MCRLSVNVNKLATLRNSRGKNNPDVADFARKILVWGAHGLTVHPRPDGRHIRLSDVDQLSSLVAEWNASAKPFPVEFNIEGFPAADFIDLLRRIKPHQATLVPDPPEVLTSNAGWDLAGREAFLRPIVRELQALGVRVSLFVDPFRFDAHQVKSLSTLRPDRIELYTEQFAESFDTPQRTEVTGRYRAVAQTARDFGVEINAGHDLNQRNLGFLCENIPFLNEVSIGHALVCEALEQGFATTIGNYLKILAPYENSHPQRAQR